MINRKSFSQIMFVMLVLILIGCASKKEEGHDHGDAHVEDQSVWEPMDAFHMVMAETFHPFKDSANLEPVKSRAAELVREANKWVDAPLPEKVDTDQVKATLQKLKEEAITLAESVKTADDNVIGDQLSQLHDTFHELQEAWYGGHH